MLTGSLAVAILALKLALLRAGLSLMCDNGKADVGDGEWSVVDAAALPGEASGPREAAMVLSVPRWSLAHV